MRGLTITVDGAVVRSCVTPLATVELSDPDVP
jgi:hypothetical protein